MKAKYSSLVAIPLALALVAPASAEQGSISRQVTFDIEASSLANALRRFSEQTGMQVFGEGVEQVTVKSLRGRYTIDAALKTLLERSGFEHEFIGDTAVELHKVADSATTVTVKEKPTQSRPHSTSTASTAPTLEEVIVNGEFANPLNLTEPTMVYSRDAIERQGVSSLPELFKNIPQQPYNTNYPRVSGAEYAELRGLGPGTTVVSINNLPVAASSGDGASGFDLTTIPLAAVKQVEITSDPPPAYIPSAVGGTVNIVLDNNRERSLADFRYAAASGGAGERKFSVAGSAGRRVKGTLALEYQQRDFLLGEKRDLWRNQDYRRFGGTDYRLPAGNIHTLTGDRLPGLNSSRAAIPAGVGDTPTAADFAATDGRVNVESLSRYYTVVPDTERGSVVGMLETSLNEAVAVSGELLYTERKVTQQRNPPILSGVLVPASNPWNLFGMPLVADLLLTDLPPQQTITESELLRSVFGIRGVSGSWNWRLSVVNTRDDVSVTSFATIPPEKVTAAVSTTDPAHSLNVFRPGSPGSRELLDLLVGDPITARTSSETTLVRATLAGKIGNMDTLLGMDTERTRSSFAEVAEQTLERNTSAAFAQLRLPLHATLDLNAGGRVDRLNDLGNMMGFQYGLKWRPVDSLSVVAAYNRGDRPPTLLEMMRPRTRTESIVVDRSRHSEVRNIDVIVGGNPDLDPMQTKSWSLGATWKPEGGMHELSVKYWDIELRDQVLVPSLPRLLEQQEYFSGRVVREPRSAEDIALGLPGPLRMLDFSRLNSGRLDTRGIDLLAAKQLDAGAFGQISGKLMATWIEDYVTADVPNVEGTDRVGIASVFGTIPRWRVVALLAWKRKTVGLSTAVRFTPSYADAFLEPTGRTIPSQTIVDLEATFELPPSMHGSLFRDVTVSLGVLNVFDKAAAFATVGHSAGHDWSQSDLLQRVGYLRLAKAF